MTERGHIPSFRAPGLPPGYGLCIRCERQITKEEWAASTCPGKPTDQQEKTRHG